MRYIEPHGHMVSRTTDDYRDMVTAGCAAVCEPAFWAGFDRSSVQGFYDYFCQLTDHEPKRAAKFGLPHYTWLCINPKESEDVNLAEEVIGIIPQFIDKPNVLGIGEIGLNKNSRNELKVLEMHIDVAAKHNQLILVHTPHLEDKLKGTRLIVDALKNDHRSRRGTHHRHRARSRFLGGHDALSREQMHRRPRHRHDRKLRQRARVDEQRLRLGRERAAGRALRRAGDAPPRLPRRAD
jgi:Tat protein secretion system quality control protein TatD with DNase activity